MNSKDLNRLPSITQSPEVWDEHVPLPPSGPIPPGMISDGGGWFANGFMANTAGTLRRSLRRTPCELFSQSLVDRLFNFNKEHGFDGSAPSGLGANMVIQAVHDVDENGTPYEKGKYPVDGFLPELVTGDPNHPLDQGADVYRHILFTAGNQQLGDAGVGANAVFVNKDLEQVKSGRLESKAELADDAAGLSVGREMLKTSRAGKSGDYARLGRRISSILCDGTI